MVWFFSAAIFALVLDFWSKWWVKAHLKLGQAVDVLPGWFHFEHVQNPGAAWGLFSGRKWLLVSFTVVVTLLVIASAKEVSSKGKLSALGFGFILGGALGNLFDRLSQGYVTDFIDLDTPIRWLQTFPVFNIADSALTVGVILLLLSMLRQDRPASTASEVAHSETPSGESPVAPESPVVKPQS
jgi:signal peptidase II